MKYVISKEAIEEKIFSVRGHKVMVDRDLAALYDVQTKYLNRQVKRNRERFPEEFMFRLTEEEKKELVTNWHRFESLKHSSASPYVFTEHGVAMLASVLNSERAVKISIHIIKTFVRLRRWISTHKELASELAKLERKVEKHDSEIQAIFDAIRKLMVPSDLPERRIGFHVD
ncbi:MAG: ORF6N domain-containing protein [Candidatus Omnitrophica bacterium]|nr:ORF6N domain-containing protein [Candidatus Omnitrophota bacterium]